VKVSTNVTWQDIAYLLAYNYVREVRLNDGHDPDSVSDVHPEVKWAKDQLVTDRQTFHFIRQLQEHKTEQPK
jgi:hypothetical protein